MGKYTIIFPQQITADFPLNFYLQEFFCTWQNFSKFGKNPKNLPPKHTLCFLAPSKWNLFKKISCECIDEYPLKG